MKGICSVYVYNNHCQEYIRSIFIHNNDNVDMNFNETMFNWSVKVDFRRRQTAAEL